MGRLALRIFSVLLPLLFASFPARAEEKFEDETAEPASSAHSSPALPIAEVRIEWVGEIFREEVRLGITAGELFDPEVVRAELERLASSGRFADVSAETEDVSGRLVLVFRLTPRRLVHDVRFPGSPVLAGEALVAIGLSRGDELTETALAVSREKVRRFYESSGFPNAEVIVSTSATDDELALIVSVAVAPGEPLLVETRRTLVAPNPPEASVRAILGRLPNLRGKRAEEKLLEDDAIELSQKIRAAGYYESEVVSRYLPRGVVETRVKLGPHFTIRISGNDAVDASEIENEFGLSGKEQIVVEALEPVLVRFYRRRGFFDAQVKIRRIESRDGRNATLDVTIREGSILEIGRRIFPCDVDELPFDLEAEVDGVLQEEFEKSGIFRDPARRTVDASLAGKVHERGATPLWSDPYDSYSEEAYAAVRKHLSELFVAEGFFAADVRAERLLRGDCRGGLSGPACEAAPRLEAESLVCERELARNPPPPPACSSDLGRGKFCAPEADVVLPIVPGPRAKIFDIRFEGNETFSSVDLERIAGLRTDDPARRADLETARVAILNHYAEAGFAFAIVEGEYEVSVDSKRARAVFQVVERKPVIVTDIRIVGANRTRIGLIEKRLSLERGKLYRKSLVEASQQQVESLGVFSSVSIGLLDPNVYSREKTVVITVSERMPQYLDVRGGLSTGEGFRVGLEYGRRNLGGEAIGVTLGVQLGIRPPFMLVEEDVRAKYENLVRGPNGLLNIIERRNSLVFSFADIGLGPLFRFEVEGLDVRSNLRDFALEKDAAITRLLFRPSRTVYFQLSTSVELNNAQILTTGVVENENLIRVPKGKSVAFAQGIEGVWDRRDRPLAAHRGTLVSLGVEHVTAVPIERGDNRCIEANFASSGSACSEFLRYTGRVAGYLPLYRGSVRKPGLVLAGTLRGGVIQHIPAAGAISRTYPDRLFFVGGVDTLRGYQNYSLVPEELAARLLDPAENFTIDQVYLRGGDLFINPRTELRIPLGGALETVLFLDAANLWQNPLAIDLTKLRYTLGTGLRIDTPVGPLVFDYGFNIARILDSLTGRTEGVRYWESTGEFHFSIGLF